MKGWEILAHSVRLVFNNIEQALKISAVPYAISALAFLVFGLPAIGALEAGTAEALMNAGSGVWLGQLAYIIISVIVTLWIAVAWHRYVLMEEYPEGWVPRLHSGPMTSYFLSSILIGLLIFGVVLVVSLLVGLIAFGLGPSGAFLLGLVAMAVGTYIFYRLCAVLPAAAVGRTMRFGEAWEATRGSGGTIAVLVLLVVVASIIIQMPTTLGSGSSIFGIIYSLIVNWLSMLIGVSVLTTFYGHYVEGRPID